MLVLALTKPAVSSYIRTMKKLLLAPLIALVIACGGDEDADLSPTTTAVPNVSPSITEAPPSPTTAPVAASPTTSAVTPTQTPAPAGPPECGRPLLQAGDRAALSGLKGRIVFVCDGQIWIARPDGTDQVRVTEPVEIDWDRVRLYRVPEDDPPNAEERAEIEDRINFAPRWLSDGRIVFSSIRDTLALSAEAPLDARRPFVGASELYVVNADGAGLRRVTEYNLTAGAYDGPFSDFEPSQCADPRFCFAGLLSLVPASAATTVPVITAQVTEIRFSECCGFLGLFDLAGGAPSLTPAALVLGLEHADNVSSWQWAQGDQSSLVMAWTAPQSPFDLTPPEARFYRGESFEVLPDVIGPGASLSPDGTRIAHCDIPAENAVPTGVFVTAVGSDTPDRLGSFEQWCWSDWSPEGTHIVTEVSGAIVVVDVQTGDSWPIALGGYPDWGP